MPPSPPRTKFNEIQEFQKIRIAQNKQQTFHFHSSLSAWRKSLWKSPT